MFKYANNNKNVNNNLIIVKHIIDIVQQYFDFAIKNF